MGLGPAPTPDAVPARARPTLRNFRSLDQSRIRADESVIAELAKVLSPQDILLLVENNGKWDFRNTLTATLPYLDPGSISRAIELADQFLEPYEKDRLLFRLMTRLGPAIFVERLLTSRALSSQGIWNGEGLEYPYAVEGEFECLEALARTLRLLGGHKRPEFTALLGMLLPATTGLGGAEAVRGVFDARLETAKWWP